MGEVKKLRRSVLLGRESGSQLVEFAMVAPILLIVLFGIIQYALIFWGYITIRTACAIGARQAIISPGDITLIRSVAQGAANAPPLIQSNLVGVSVETNLINGTLISTVTVSSNFRIFVPFVIPPFTGTGSTNRVISATTIVQ
jgi:Flp pilus assembly protein TadG